MKTYNKKKPEKVLGDPERIASHYPEESWLNRKKKNYST